MQSRARGADADNKRTDTKRARDARDELGDGDGHRYAAAVCLRGFSRVRLSATLWTAACQAPLSMGSSRQGDWSGLLFPPPGGLPHPGTEPGSRLCTPWEALKSRMGVGSLKSEMWNYY